MMRVFLRSGIHGKAKEARSLGVVERGCEEFAGLRERKAVGDADGQAAAALAGCGCTKGDETRNSVSIDQKKGALASARSAAVGVELGEYFLEEHAEPAAADGSLMIVIATDAPLSDRNLSRRASRSNRPLPL
jgi:hypothetical protein